MRKELFIDAMSELKEKYIAEAAFYQGNTRPRFSVALAAAMLALFLLGCTAAGVIFGDSIQGWFNHYWKEMTGRPMSENQLAVIDHLSQPIHLSQTCAGVTVTVDSAAAGEDNFYVLLRVNAEQISYRYNYGFAVLELSLNPDPLDGGGLGGYGIDYLGLDGDGSALFLLDYEYASTQEYTQDTSPLKVELRLEDFGRNMHTSQQKIINEGEWTFSFTMDCSDPLPTLLLPDTEVSVLDCHFENPVSVMLTDIVLTNTGIRFHYPQKWEDVPFSTQLELILQNGVAVANGGGVAAVMEDTEILSASYKWLVPVDLNEVAAVQIGETKLFLSERKDENGS